MTDSNSQGWIEIVDINGRWAVRARDVIAICRADRVAVIHLRGLSDVFLTVTPDAAERLLAQLGVPGDVR
jgi:hypothetical protein